MGRKRRSKPPGFSFIPMDQQGKVSTAQSKIIRSYVMRGKNTHARTKKAMLSSSPGDQAGKDADEVMVVGPTNLRGSQSFVWDYPISVPRLASYSSMVRFCEEIDRVAFERLFNYYTSFKHLLHPIDQCYAHDPTKSLFFDWMFDDIAYLHVNLYLSYLLHDAARGGAIGSAAKYHLYRSIKALNERLADKETILSDSTAATIMALLYLAECTGDTKLSRLHIGGLQKLVQMRGGIDSFGHNPTLQDKILRSDLVHVVSSGSDPVFYGQVESFDICSDSLFYLSLPGPPAEFDSVPASAFIRAIDYRLYNVLHDLHSFSYSANKLFQSGEKIPYHISASFMKSIQYRLLFLQLKRCQEVGEMLRLAMIAYLTTIFQWFPGNHERFPFLAAKLRVLMRNLNPKGPEECYLYSWALTIAAIAVFDPRDEVWLNDKLTTIVRPCVGSTWDESRKQIKKFLWIDSIHDKRIVAAKHFQWGVASASANHLTYPNP
ncbi:hypothetical protein GQ53DRAFT_719792 [Thozetella sp. PMI_491]|nr:hypothetical protein GQ53DRAFT_719792 [Thozetella sp. PMI_491]